MNDSQQQAGQRSNTYQQQPPSFSILRVLSTVLVLAAIGGGGYAAFQFLGPGGTKLVKVRGQVMWKGKPVTIGAVMTEHLDDRTQAALGALDKEGWFELDTNGEPGAVPGEHKLAVASFIPEGAASIPAVPAQYTSINSTPIRVKISTDPEKNRNLKIVLEGDLPARRGRPSSDEDESEPASEEPAAAADENAGESPAPATTAPETQDETPAAETPANTEQPVENPAP